MKHTSFHAFRGRTQETEYYLTMVKADRALALFQKPPDQATGERTQPTSQEDPGAGPPHTALVMGLQGGDPEFIPIEVTGNFQADQETRFETPDLQVGVFRLTAPGELFLLDGESRLESIREEARNGNTEIRNDDIPVMIVEYPGPHRRRRKDSPEN